MSHRAGSAIFVAAVCALLFAFAFAAAPNSCAWGLDAYFWAGIAAVLVLMAAPAIRHGELPLLQRLGLSLGLAVTGIAVWAGGLFAANMQIICRLF